MNYLSVEKLSKSYGEKSLFDQITFGLEKGDKVALIAKNGAGKSTLLNVIAGLDYPDDGRVVLRKEIRVSYLPQMDDFPASFSVLDSILEADTPIIQTIKEYESALLSASKESNKKDAKRLEKAISEMDRLEAWGFENRIKEVLSKFGIDDIFRNVKELSGGERKKIALAKTLLSDSDFLILDEPTNHLDIDMIEWIEEFLSTSNTTLLMVTHDRFFLDKVCNRVIELDNGNLYQYNGKYDYYLEKKSERLALDSVKHEKLRNLYQKELAWVRTSPQARTTKSKSRIQAFEELEKNLAQKTETPISAFSIHSERLGNKILEINNLNFSFPNKIIVDDFSYIFKKGEKCGVVGKNGSGKSTFLKLIMQELKPNHGKITAGATIKFGYFSQDGLLAEGGKRILDIVKEKAEIVRTANGNFITAAQFLNHFGFKYNQQYAYYDDLSGGEKRKLHLLIVLMQNPNFLILDEPTNDFDIDTLNILEDFLQQFEGCLLIVSHDRWFMNKLVDHLFVFEDNGKVKDFYGNYSDYKKEQKRSLAIEKRKIKQQPVATHHKSTKVNNQKLTYKEKIELNELEQEIEWLENKIANILKKMNDGNFSDKELHDLALQYEESELTLERKSERWFVLTEKQQL